MRWPIIDFTWFEFRSYIFSFVALKTSLFIWLPIRRSLIKVTYSNWKEGIIFCKVM